MKIKFCTHALLFWSATAMANKEQSMRVRHQQKTSATTITNEAANDKTVPGDKDKRRNLEGEVPVPPAADDLEERQTVVDPDTTELVDDAVELPFAQCEVGANAALGNCVRPNSLKFIVNSCGDIYGPTVLNRAMEASGQDLTSNSTKEHFSEAWAYMASLEPDDVFLVGDNVYNDAIANWGKDYHPFGNNLAVILSDASEPFLQYHGFLTEDKLPGPLYYSYLELLKDKLNDGYFDNEEFNNLRALTRNSIHATWDDHDYLTNDASNPHYLRHEFRKAEIEALTGWDRNYFRFGPSHKGIERTWTKELTDNNGNPFLVRFIVLDEETTHNAVQGCTYYYDPSSPTGFAPRQKGNSDLPCPDQSVMEDFEEENPERVFFGDDQLNWFREQLMKPADLIFVVNGGPNFEVDYAYASLTEYPGEKRKLVELMRETGAEHIIFLTGDSHASYVTKTPNLVGYPLYTIVGSGLTQGLSYDRYIGNWGDISHRFLVAAGSNEQNKAAATFAEVQVMFDDGGAFVRFIPHLKDGVGTSGSDGWTGEWYAKTEKNSNEPWDAQYDIRVSELEIATDWPRYHFDSSIPHKFVPEDILLKWANTTGPADEVTVTLTITNADGVSQTYPLAQGNSCGTGFFGFCKDKWGALSYVALKVGDYAPSKAIQEICEHAGLVGDEIMWSIEENGQQVADGEFTLKIRNNVLVNSAGDLRELEFYGSAEAYNPVGADSVGVLVTTIINEPELYGGYQVPVKGYDPATDEFSDSTTQEAYTAWKAASEPKDSTELMAAYLAAFYPDLPQF